MRFFDVSNHLLCINQSYMYSYRYNTGRILDLISYINQTSSMGMTSWSHCRNSSVQQRAKLMVSVTRPLSLTWIKWFTQKRYWSSIGRRSVERIGRYAVLYGWSLKQRWSSGSKQTSSDLLLDGDQSLGKYLLQFTGVTTVDWCPRELCHSVKTSRRKQLLIKKEIREKAELIRLQSKSEALEFLSSINIVYLMESETRFIFSQLLYY